MSCRRSLQFMGYALAAIVFSLSSSVYAQSDDFKENIYQVPKLKPTDSATTLKAGDKAPDFTLPAVDGKERRQDRGYLRRKNR